MREKQGKEKKICVPPGLATVFHYRRLCQKSLTKSQIHTNETKQELSSSNTPNYSHQNPVDARVTNAGRMRTIEPLPSTTTQTLNISPRMLTCQPHPFTSVARKENVRPLYDFCLGYLPSVAAEVAVGRQHKDVPTAGETAV